MATVLRAHNYIKPDDADYEHKQEPEREHAPASTQNPYLAARREWDERYGNLITRERNWRRMALLCALTTLVAIGGIVRMSSQSHIVPFVVALDSLGRTVAAGPATESSGADDRLKRATLRHV